MTVLGTNQDTELWGPGLLCVPMTLPTGSKFYLLVKAGFGARSAHANRPFYQQQQKYFKLDLYYLYHQVWPFLSLSKNRSLRVHWKEARRNLVIERNSQHLDEICSCYAEPKLFTLYTSWNILFYLKKCPDSKTFSSQTCEVSTARFALACSLHFHPVCTSFLQGWNATCHHSSTE